MTAPGVDPHLYAWLPGLLSGPLVFGALTPLVLRRHREAEALNGTRSPALS